MKLLHELKAMFPLVPDECVKRCVETHGKDRSHCISLMTSESDSMKAGPLNRRFSLQALLSHQMEQRLKLEKEVRKERNELFTLRAEIQHLSSILDQKNMVRLGPFGANVNNKSVGLLEHDVSCLHKSCDQMAEEVTKLTQGQVPLGETSILFYESLPTRAPPSSTVMASAAAASLPVLSSSSTASQGLKEVGNNINNNNAANNDLSVGSSNRIGQNNNTDPQQQQTSVVNPPKHSPRVIEQVDLSSQTGPSEGPQWPCSECTFLNHPALDRCEECEMPRINIEAGAGGESGSEEQTFHQSCFCHPTAENCTNETNPGANNANSPSSVRPSDGLFAVLPKTDATSSGEGRGEEEGTTSNSVTSQRMRKEEEGGEEKDDDEDPPPFSSLMVQPPSRAHSP